MTKRILLLDGDLAVYRNAAAIEKRTIDVTHIKSGKSKSFQNRTEFKKFLSDKGFEYDESKYKIEDKQEAMDVAIAYKIIDNFIASLDQQCWFDEIEIWLGQSGNTFRHHLPLPTPYKANRGDLIKPIHLDLCKSYLTKQWKAKLTDSELETDDMLTIRCYEEKAKGNYPIMATIDKDAGQTQGIAIVNWLDEPMKIVEVPSLGEVFKHKTTYKGNGLKFLAWQALAGDPTDTYKPYELSRFNYGPGKAADAINKATNEKEVLEILIGEYKRLYPDKVHYRSHNGRDMTVEWDDILEMYWKCAYMKRDRIDPSDFWLFAEHYGVKHDEATV